MRNRLHRLAERFRDWRCRNIHNDPCWPINGKSECRKCQRHLKLEAVR